MVAGSIPAPLTNKIKRTFKLSTAFEARARVVAMPWFKVFRKCKVAPIGLRSAHFWLCE